MLYVTIAELPRVESGQMESRTGQVSASHWRFEEENFRVVEGSPIATLGMSFLTGTEAEVCFQRRPQRNYRPEHKTFKMARAHDAKLKHCDET